MDRIQRVSEFGDWLLDEDAGTLSRAGKLVSLTPKAFDTLAHLVASGGRLVSKRELLEAVWADVHVEENNVEQQISALRRALGDGIIQTVPRRGYRFVASVRRSPPAVQVANVTDLPLPEPQRARARSRPGSRAALVLAGLLAIAGAFAVRQRPEERPGEDTAHPGPLRVAVLPFAPLGETDEGPQGSGTVLGLGLADAVITRLGRQPGLELRPTSAVRHLDGLADPVAAGRELRVDALLQSTFRREAGWIRVRSQLVHARDATTLWSAQFDVPVDRLPHLEDEITSVLAARLAADGTAPAPAGPSREVSPAAYLAHLQGRWAWSRRTGADFVAAERAVRRALELDPRFAPALAGLADALLAQGRDEEAAEHARRALALDDRLAEPHATLGFLAFFHDRDSRLATTELSAALERNPSYSTARQWLAFVHVARGRCAEAAREIRAARALDPTSSTILTDLAHIDYYCRDFAAAEREVRQALALDARFGQAYVVLGQVLVARGRLTAAREAIEQAGRQAGIDLPLLEIEVLARAGDAAAADRLFRKLPAEVREDGGYLVGRALAAMGRHDEAVAALRRAESRRESHLMLLGIDPALQELRADARVRALLARLGLA